MQQKETARQKEADSTGIKIPKTIRRSVLITIGSVVVVVGVIVSYFFTQATEGFFWEARTNFVGEAVNETGKHALQKGDLKHWENSEARSRIDYFAKEIKEYVPNTSAVKIYTTDGVLAWTDLQGVKPGYQKPASDGELARVASEKHLIMKAGDAVKKELHNEDLLEVWSVLVNSDGEIDGFVEIYFDINDIKTFITRIRYTVMVGLFLLTTLILAILHTVFRQQDSAIIKQSRELFNIIEGSPIGIYTIDPTGVITSINPKMLSLLGMKNRSDAIGKNVFDFERTRQLGIGDLINKAILGNPFSKDVSGINEKGEEMHRHYQGSPLIASDKKTVEQVLFIVEDITERKRLENELAHRAENLEESVHERTKELQGKIDELERFERLAVGREVRMTELKQQIEKMRIKCESLGVDVSAL